MAKILSIEISNSLIRICEMDYKKKNPRVYRQAMVSTPVGAYSDGYLNSMDELKNTIKNALTENQMKTKDVIFTIASTKIVNREVMLPGVKQSMLGAMIKTNLNEYFPIDLSNYEIAHQVLEQMTEGQDAGKYRTMIMAAEKSLVESYDKLASLCGLRLVSLDYAGNSVFQAIKNEDTAARVMVLKIEENQTMISIVKNKSLMLQRNVNYGLVEGIQEVMKQPVFGVDNYNDAWELLKNKTCIKFNVSEIAMKNSLNKDLSTDLETRDFDESQEIREAKIEVTKSLEPLISSIRRVVEFYASRNNGEAVDRIIITGFGGAMSGLAKLLTNELGINAAVLNRMEGVGYLVTSQDAKIFNFVSCIGATFAPVGFVSREKKAKEKKETDFTMVTILLIVAVILVSAAMSMLSYLDYKKAQDEEAELMRLEQTYKKSEQVYYTYNNLLTFHQQVLAGDKMTARPNDRILQFLEELEAMLPENVMVKQFTSDDVQVVMTMSVDSKETAAGVIANMREFKSIKSVSVPAIAENVDGESDVSDLEVGEKIEGEITFTITAIYHPAGYVEEITE